MPDNAELWSYPDEESQRRTVTNWLKSNHIQYNEEDTIEELTQLYIDIECGKYGTMDKRLSHVPFTHEL